MSKRPTAILSAVLLTTLSAGVLSCYAQSSHKSIDSFRPLTTFSIPNGGVAEILTSTPDGKTIVYSNAGDRNIGLVNLTNPLLPRLITTLEMPGEPTSVAITPDGTMAVVAVITSNKTIGKVPVITPGKLMFIDLNTNTVKGEVSIGDHPDSVAIAEIDGKTLAIVAIENEPVVVDDKGLLTEVTDPGSKGDISKPGCVQIVDINSVAPSLSSVKDVSFDEAALKSAGLLFADDVQPEFIKIKNGKAAVTLQENNGVAIVDLASGKVDRLFSTGYVTYQPADFKADGIISFTDVYSNDVDKKPCAGARMPDAIAWNASGTVIYTADEGELNFTGGRGWSAWSPTGSPIWNDRGSLEQEAALYGYYPDSRSSKKGIEAEGVETGVYGKNEFAFVGSERGSFVGVYNINNPYSPKLVQLLPTGLSPEGLLAIPQRDLFLTSDELSGTVTIFEGVSGLYVAPIAQPTLKAVGPESHFSAISGLAGDASDSDVLYAVPDVAMKAAIYQINLDGGNAQVSLKAAVTEDGKSAVVDLEGITRDTSIAAGPKPGFWLASEGNAAFKAKNYLQNALLQVDADGRVMQKVFLPSNIDSPSGGVVDKSGFEGVAVSTDGRCLIVPIQRAFAGDQKVADISYTRIGKYDLGLKAWEFYLYPLEKTEIAGDWIGLSEIVNFGNDLFAVIERDKQVGGAIKLKAVYSFCLDGVTPYDGLVTKDTDVAKHSVKKTLIADVRNAFTPYEKVEGLTVTPSGMIWAAMDNDGGLLESRLSAIGMLQNIVK